MTSTVTLISMGRYVIDVHAPEPSYLQLASQLRARIASGEIGPREALPSITYLTGETGLHYRTWWTATFGRAGLCRSRAADRLLKAPNYCLLVRSSTR